MSPVPNFTIFAPANAEVLVAAKSAKTIPSTIITIVEWGMCDDMIIRPDDQLVLGEEEEGDLLVIQPKDKLSPPKFARRYGGSIIAEPQKCPVSMLRWEVVAAVKMLQKDLSCASLGDGNWYIRIHNHNLPEYWVQYIEEQPLSPVYLEELGKQLLAYDANISVCAGKTRDDLETTVLPSPGTIGFVMRRNELASGYVSTWALASRREMRRRRTQRRNNTNIAELYPIPNFQDTPIFVESIACK